MRKLLLFGCVVLMCGSVAFGAHITPRFVHMGAPPVGTAPNDPAALDWLAYGQGMSNDHGVLGGPTVVGRAFYDDGAGGTVVNGIVWQGGTFNRMSDGAGGYADVGFNTNPAGTAVGLVTGGYGGTAIATTNSIFGWGTATVSPMANVGAGWLQPRLAQNGTLVGGNSPTGPALWSSGPRVPIAGITSFIDISEDGNYALGAAPTLSGYGVQDIAGGTLRNLPTHATYNLMYDIKAISGSGKYVVGTIRSGTVNKAYRKAAIWEWNGTSYNAPVVVDTGVRNNVQDISSDENGIRGCLVIMNRLTTKTIGTVSKNGFHAYGFHTNDVDGSGNPLTMAQSYGMLMYKLQAAGVTVPTTGYMTFSDGGGASANGLSWTGQFYDLGNQANNSDRTAYFATLPEPATLTLLLLGLPFLRRRR